MALVVMPVVWTYFNAICATHVSRGGRRTGNFNTTSWWSRRWKFYTNAMLWSSMVIVAGVLLGPRNFLKTDGETKLCVRFYNACNESLEGFLSLELWEALCSTVEQGKICKRGLVPGQTLASH